MKIQDMVSINSRPIINTIPVSFEKQNRRNKKKEKKK